MSRRRAILTALAQVLDARAVREADLRPVRIVGRDSDGIPLVQATVGECVVRSPGAKGEVGALIHEPPPTPTLEELRPIKLRPIPSGPDESDEGSGTQEGVWTEEEIATEEEVTGDDFYAKDLELDALYVDGGDLVELACAAAQTLTLRGSGFRAPITAEFVEHPEIAVTVTVASSTEIELSFATPAVATLAVTGGAVRINSDGRTAIARSSYSLRCPPPISVPGDGFLGIFLRSGGAPASAGAGDGSGGWQGVDEIRFQAYGALGQPSGGYYDVPLPEPAQLNETMASSSFQDDNHAGPRDLQILWKTGEVYSPGAIFFGGWNEWFTIDWPSLEVLNFEVYPQQKDELNRNTWFTTAGDYFNNDDGWVYVLFNWSRAFANPSFNHSLWKFWRVRHDGTARELLYDVQIEWGHPQLLHYDSGSAFYSTALGAVVYELKLDGSGMAPASATKYGSLKSYRKSPGDVLSTGRNATVAVSSQNASQTVTDHWMFATDPSMNNFAKPSCHPSFDGSQIVVYPRAASVFEVLRGPWGVDSRTATPLEPVDGVHPHFVLPTPGS